MTVTFTKDVYVDDAVGTPGTGFSATRMNNLNDTLEKVCQSINRDTTYVVAPNDCSTIEEQAADYVCDATDDHVQINAAIDAAAALTAAGGKIVMLGGAFRIGGAIRPKSNIILQGVGPATVIKVADGFSGTEFGYIYNATAGGAGDTGIVIRDLMLDGNKAAITTTGLAGVYLEDAARCLVDNVIVHDFGNTGIYLHADSADNLVHRCRAYACDLYGYYVAGTRERIVESVGHDNGYRTIYTPSTSSYNKILGCQVRASGDNAIHLLGTYHAAAGNLVEANTKNGIYMDADHGILNGNMLVGNGTAADDTYSNIYLAGDYNNVQNNTCRRGAAANKSKYGLYVHTGATSNLVTNNDLYDGGTTGNLQDSGTTTVTAAGNRTT